MRSRLVLLPGMDGTGELFAPLQAELGPETAMQVVRYPPDRPLNYQDLIARVRDDLPRDEDSVLLGESFSGPIAIALAAEAPAGLRGLILCCSFARNPRPLLSLLHPLGRLLPPARILLGSRAAEPLRAALARALSGVKPEVLQRRLREIRRVDVRAELARVRVPILYLQAAQDRVTPRRSAEEILRIQPSAQILRLAGPHLLLQASAAPAAAAIRVFLRSADGSVKQHCSH